MDPRDPFDQTHKILEDVASGIFFIGSAILIAFLLVSILGILSACSSTPSSITPSVPVKYELMLAGTINGTAFQGVGIGSSDPTHQMTIQSAIAVNYFTMESCHRSIQFTDVIKVPWYDWSKDNKSFSFTYTEAPTIEDSGDCILRFCAFSKTVGSPPSSCAIVDFKNKKYSLPAQNICNGVNGSASGTMICHTQVGLLERVQFKEPVQVAPQVVDPTGQTAPYWIKDQCVGSFIDQNHMIFQYQVPENECVVIFDQIAKPHARAKLSVIPFDTALYPGGS